MITATLRDGGRGIYDMWHEATKIAAKGNGRYIIAIDIFCGQDSLEGGMYRRHYANISANDVADIIRSWREYNRGERMCNPISGVIDMLRHRGTLRRGRRAAWDN